MGLRRQKFPIRPRGDGDPGGADRGYWTRDAAEGLGDRLSPRNLSWGVGAYVLQLFVLPSSTKPRKPENSRRSSNQGTERVGKLAKYLADAREHVAPSVLDAEAKGGEQQPMAAEHPQDAVQHRHRREEQPQQVEELPMVLEVEPHFPRVENAVLMIFGVRKCLLRRELH